MWIYISVIAKTSVFPHKTKVGKSHNSNPTKYPQVIVENTENSPNSSYYTMEYKLVRNSHLLSQKIGILSSATAIVQHTKRKLLTHKLSKAAINCSYIYCEEIYGKVLQTRTILFKRTIVVTGVRKSTNISAQNTEQINLTYIVNYNKNISKWLVLLVQKAAFP